MVGNLASFRKLDIIRCLLRIEKPISRANLSKMLSLGEGTIRSILDILKENDLLASNKQGHSLSAKGKLILKKIKTYIDIDKVNLNNMFKNKKKIIIHINHPNKIEKAYELRDIALKNGADGALILKYDNGLKLYDSEIDSDFKEIEDKFNLEKDSIVVMAYADSYNLAEHGALAVAMEINSNLKNIMQEIS